MRRIVSRDRRDTAARQARLKASDEAQARLDSITTNVDILTREVLRPMLKLRWDTLRALVGNPDLILGGNEHVSILRWDFEKDPTAVLNRAFHGMTLEGQQKLEEFRAKFCGDFQHEVSTIEAFFKDVFIEVKYPLDLTHFISPVLLDLVPRYFNDSAYNEPPMGHMQVSEMLARHAIPLGLIKKYQMMTLISQS